MTRSKNARIPAPDYAPGTRFGVVTILGRQPSYGTGRVYRVRCDCGAERDVMATSLRQFPPRTHRLCRRAQGAA